MKKTIGTVLMMAAWVVALSARSAAEVPVLAEFPRDMSSLVTALKPGNESAAISRSDSIDGLYSYGKVYDILTGDPDAPIARLAAGNGDTIGLWAAVEGLDDGAKRFSVTARKGETAVRIFEMEYGDTARGTVTDFLCDGNSIQVIGVPDGSANGFLNVLCYAPHDLSRIMESESDAPCDGGFGNYDLRPLSAAATRREYGKFRQIDNAGITPADLLSTACENSTVLHPRFVRDNLLQCQNGTHPDFQRWNQPTFMALGKCTVNGKEILLLGVDNKLGPDYVYALVNEGSPRYPRSFFIYQGEGDLESGFYTMRTFQICPDRIIVKQGRHDGAAPDLTTFEFVP